MKSIRHMIFTTLTAVTVAAASAPKSGARAHALPEIGKNIERQSGGWINFSMSGARAVVKFFDTEKKEVLPDTPRGLAIFRYASKSDSERTTFHVEDNALHSPSNVRPPHRFRVTLTLLGTEEERREPETFNFNYP